MSREIKFRGRSIKDNKTWFTGSLVSLTDIDEAYIDHYDGLRRVIERYPVNPATVGQFTGLHDADRREIYEGDVIRVCGANGIVVYSEGAFIVRFEKGPSLLSHCICGDFSNPVRVSSCRVIGNVHDSPELLEGKDA